MASKQSLSYIIARGTLGLALLAGASSLVLALVDLRADSLEVDIARAVQGVPVPQQNLATISGTRAGFTGDVHLSIHDAPLWLRLEAALPSLVLALAMVAIAVMLFSVVLKLQEGAGLTAATVRTLRRVLLTIAVTSLLRPALQFLVAKSVIAYVATPSGYVTEYLYNSPNWFAALPALAVAAVLLLVVEGFRQGQSIADEVKGLI